MKKRKIKQKNREKSKLKQAQIKSGFTVEDIADFFIVSKQCVYKWLKKPENMRISKALELCDLLKVDIKDII